MTRDERSERRDPKPSMVMVSVLVFELISCVLVFIMERALIVGSGWKIRVVIIGKSAYEFNFIGGAVSGQYSSIVTKEEFLSQDC